MRMGAYPLASQSPTQSNTHTACPEPPLVPGLEDLGYSRITTVEACQAFTGVVDWAEMLTDTEFEVMEACLIEHT